MADDGTGEEGETAAGTDAPTGTDAPGDADEVARLRREADTILTRYDAVQDALDDARSSEGDHWDDGSLALTLDAPDSGTVKVTIPLDGDPGSAAQRRYDRAARLAERREERAAVDDRLAVVPADPLAYLVLYHLDAVGSDYPKSIAGYCKADREAVVETCEALRNAGVVERIESGTVKRRNAKAKRTDEVRQHHTYYRLSREGDHLLRFFGDEEGKANVLRHLPDARRLLDAVRRDGPASPRGVAADGDRGDDCFEAVRHRFEALRRVGLLATVDGPGDGGDGSRDDATDDHGGTPTYYATTAVAERLLDGA